MESSRARLTSRRNVLPKRRRRAGSAESIESGGGGGHQRGSRRPRPSDVPPSGAALLVALAARESESPRGIRSSAVLPASELSRAALLSAALTAGTRALRAAAARGKPARILSDADAPPARAPPLGDICALAAAASPPLPSARGAGVVGVYTGAATSAVVTELSLRALAAAERVRQLRVQWAAADGNLGWGSWGRGGTPAAAAAAASGATVDATVATSTSPSKKPSSCANIDRRQSAVDRRESAGAASMPSMGKSGAATVSSDDPAVAAATAELVERGHAIISLSVPPPIAAATILAAAAAIDAARDTATNAAATAQAPGAPPMIDVTRLGWQADVELPNAPAALAVLEGLLFAI